MNRTFGWIALASTALFLGACGGGNHDTPATNTPTETAKPTVAVDDLGTGSFVVSVGDANAPAVGKYYGAADGTRLLVLSDSEDHATQSYRRAAGGAWVAVPGTDKDVQVHFLRSNALPDLSLSLAALAKHYRVMVAAGVSADFTLMADGTITPGTTSCKLSGKVSAGALPNTMKLSLATTGCALPSSATGVIAFDGDYAPAAFRMLADDGAQIVDLWAYPE